mmetsp:Transcript_151884/g.487418  ORF Transcript_151884/g.487418 Transcript_151884/m.487418 type:complete len:207 (+) Transcript_151884:710-1330(+)
MQPRAIPDKGERDEGQVVRPNSQWHWLRILRVARPPAEQPLHARASWRRPVDREVVQHDAKNYSDPCLQGHSALYLPHLQVGGNEPDQQAEHGRVCQADDQAEEQNPNSEVHQQHLLFVLPNHSGVGLDHGNALLYEVFSRHLRHLAGGAAEARHMCGAQRQRARRGDPLEGGVRRRRRRRGGQLVLVIVVVDADAGAAYGRRRHR